MARHFAFPWAELQQGFALPARHREKQYLLGLIIAAPVYGVFYWRRLALPVTWTSLATVVFGVLAAAVPTLLYVAFNRNEYMLYESSFVRDFWHAMQSAPFPNGIRPFTKQLWDCFFAVPDPRFFYPRCFAYSTAILLVLATGCRTGSLDRGGNIYVVEIGSKHWVRKTSKVYVADPRNERIQVFDPERKVFE
jgi:hypothetical protein